MEKTSGAELYAALDDGPRSSVETVEVFSEIDSTNTYLLRQATPRRGQCRIAIAHQQTAGRGRMGNVWQSPAEAGLYLSCAYTFPTVQKHLSSLTLAVGVAVAEALNGFGANCKLKWPNDLVVNDSKLGGILTEVHAAKSETVTVVIGVGLNLDFGKQLECIKPSIGKVTDLRHALSVSPDRNEITKQVVEHVIGALIRFDTDGFISFQARWPGLDWLFDKTVQVSTADSDVIGLVSGIDEAGALLLTINGQVERVSSGTVTVQESSGQSR